MPPTVYRSSK